MSQEPKIPVEHIERPTGKMFTKIMNRLRYLRQTAVDDAKRKMYERHNISYRNENEYKIVQDHIVTPGGKEVIELRLYKLVDGAAITINADVTSEIEGGIGELREFKHD